MRPMRLLDLTLPTAAETWRSTKRCWTRPRRQQPAGNAPPVGAGRAAGGGRPLVEGGRRGAARCVPRVGDPRAAARQRRRGHRRRSGLLDVCRGAQSPDATELRAVDRAHQFVLGTLTAGAATAGPRRAMPRHQRLGHRPAKSLGQQRALQTRAPAVPRHALVRLPARPDRPLSPHAAREPNYREGRPHAEFVTNLPATVVDIRRALATAWNTIEPLADWPREQTARLVAERYGREEWNHG